MQVVILAGGLGTRMREHAVDMHKAMIPVHGEPFVGHQLRLLAAGTVRDVVLSIGHCGAGIRDYVGDGGRWNLRVQYCDEGHDLRGTGGALRLANERGLLKEFFAVLYGDSYLPVAYADVWRCFAQQTEPALLTVYRNDDRFDRSNVSIQPDGSVRYDKTRTLLPNHAYTHIDYGLSAFRADAFFAAMPSDPVVDLGAVVSRMSFAGEVRGYEVSQRFYEIGSPAGLADFAAFLRA